MWLLNKKRLVPATQKQKQALRLVSFLERHYLLKFYGYNLSLLQHPLWDGGKSTKNMLKSKKNLLIISAPPFLPILSAFPILPALPAFPENFSAATYPIQTI